MVRLREAVNPEERSHAFMAGPTKQPTQANRYGLRCGDCGDLYYVDDGTMRRVRSAHEGDPSEVPFRCDNCEEEYAEDSNR